MRGARPHDLDPLRDDRLLLRLRDFLDATTSSRWSARRKVIENILKVYSNFDLSAKLSRDSPTQASTLQDEAAGSVASPKYRSHGSRPVAPSTGRRKSRYGQTLFGRTPLPFFVGGVRGVQGSPHRRPPRYTSLPPVTGVMAWDQPSALHPPVTVGILRAVRERGR